LSYFNFIELNLVLHQRGGGGGDGGDKIQKLFLKAILNENIFLLKTTTSTDVVTGS